MPAMTDEEFDQLTATATAALRDKQARLQAEFDLARLPRWRFDQGAEALLFEDEHGHLVLAADAVPMGSLATVIGRPSQWKWAWCNPSITPLLRDRALPLKGLAALTGMAAFASEEPLQIDETLAWDLAALGVHRLQARGCFCAPMGNGVQSFLALMDLRKVVQ
jgi:hypothetical protein